MFTKTVNKDRAFVCRRAACVCVLSSVCHADCPSECIIMTPAILPTIRPVVSLLPAAAAEAKRLTSRGRSLTDIAQCRETLAQWPPLTALRYFLTRSVGVPTSSPVCISVTVRFGDKCPGGGKCQVFISACCFPSVMPVVSMLPSGVGKTKYGVMYNNIGGVYGFL